MKVCVTLKPVMSEKSMPTLAKILQLRRERHATLVLVTGVFDVLHQEHCNFLQEAKKLGHYLVVGIESDARVKALKGPSRPIHAQQERLQTLWQLGFIDYCFILPEQFSQPADHERLIAKIQPDFLAVSSSTPHLFEKQQIVEKYGGQLQIVHQHNPAISSTQIIQSWEKPTKPIKKEEKE